MGDTVSAAAAAASVTLLIGLSSAICSVHGFIQEVKSRQSNLEDITAHLGAILAQLSSIQEIVRPIQKLLEENPVLPAELLNQILSTITECHNVVYKIETTADKFRNDKFWTEARWSLEGKDHIKELLSNLERHKITLNMGFLAVQVGMLVETKGDRRAVQNNTNNLGTMLVSIVASINGLRDEIDTRRSNQPRDTLTEHDWILDKYLENLQSYTMSLQEKSVLGGPRLNSPGTETDRSSTTEHNEASQSSGRTPPGRLVPSENLIHGARNRLTLSTSQCVELDNKLMSIEIGTTADHIVELIRQGASTSAKGLQNLNPEYRFLDTSPLFWAVWHGNSACLKTLLAHGAGADQDNTIPAALLALVLGDSDAITQFRKESIPVYMITYRLDSAQASSCRRLLRLCEPRLPPWGQDCGLPEPLVAATLMGGPGSGSGGGRVYLHTLVENGLVRDRGRLTDDDGAFLRLEARTEARLRILDTLLLEFWEYSQSMVPSHQQALNRILSETVRHWTRLRDESQCHARVTVLLRHGARVEDDLQTCSQTDPATIFTTDYVDSKNEVYDPIKNHNLLPIPGVIVHGFDSLFQVLLANAPAHHSSERYRSLYCALAAVTGRFEIADRLLHQEPQPTECIHMLVWLWSRHSVTLEAAMQAVQLFRSRGFSPQHISLFPWRRRWQLWGKDTRVANPVSNKLESRISARQLANEIHKDQWGVGMARRDLEVLLDYDIPGQTWYYH
ncbi:hypothetical protein PspLS_10478 [Pyricularia sp. CBS 133598]|nr:hypothetical protein PspLS_10478 [Pyricularia sp. CBS 133598]